MSLQKNKILSKISALINKDFILENDIIALYCWLRHLLETIKEKDSFSTLSFYCDWFQHCAVDRSITCARVIERAVTAMLAAEKASGTPDVYNILYDELFDALRTAQLHDEMCNIFDIHVGKCPIFLDKNTWPAFLVRTILLLQDKPVSLVNNGSTKNIIYNKITDVTRGVTCLAMTTISFSTIDNYDVDGDCVCIVLNNRNSIKISIPILQIRHIAGDGHAYFAVNGCRQLATPN